MLNTFIKFWTKTPIMIRTANFILVWFGVIVGIILGFSVTLALILAPGIGNANYRPFFNHYFILFPAVYVLGTLIFFQEFWLEIGKIVKRLLTKEKYEWLRPRAVFFGGFLGCALYVIMLGYLHRISVWYAADFLVLFLPFTHGFARLGCLNLGCCHGKVCAESHFLKVVYSHPQSEPARNGGKKVPRYAVQLYEMILCISLGIFLWSLLGKVSAGKIFAVYLIGYGFIRFFLEFVRDNTYELQIGMLSIWQYISFVCVLLGIILWSVLKNAPPLILTIKPVEINLGKYILIGLWNALVVGITFSLHFRKAGQSL
jgi:prolipoprotein diacylglyceryltransferase